MQDK
jgi:hypothetical protein